jgi:hypothetical protein
MHTLRSPIPSKARSFWKSSASNKLLGVYLGVSE